MIKHLLGIVCALSMFFSCIPREVAANAAADPYMVGYAIRDVNPWVWTTMTTQKVFKSLYQ